MGRSTLLMICMFASLAAPLMGLQPPGPAALSPTADPIMAKLRSYRNGSIFDGGEFTTEYFPPKWQRTTATDQPVASTRLQASGMPLFQNEAQLQALLGVIKDTRSIAVVGSSGNMVSKAQGPEIDTHAVIIRSNGAPTAGFEKDVGHQTTITVCHEWGKDDARSRGIIPRIWVNIPTVNSPSNRLLATDGSFLQGEEGGSPTTEGLSVDEHIGYRESRYPPGLEAEAAAAPATTSGSATNKASDPPPPARVTTAAPATMSADNAPPPPPPAPKTPAPPPPPPPPSTTRAPATAPPPPPATTKPATTKPASPPTPPIPPTSAPASPAPAPAPAAPPPPAPATPAPAPAPAPSTPSATTTVATTPATTTTTTTTTVAPATAPPPAQVLDIRLNKDWVMHTHSRLLEGQGTWPSTGFIALSLAVELAERDGVPVDVWGYGASECKKYYDCTGEDKHSEGSGVADYDTDGYHPFTQEAIVRQQWAASGKIRIKGGSLFTHEDAVELGQGETSGKAAKTGAASSDESNIRESRYPSGLANTEK